MTYLFNLNTLSIERVFLCLNICVCKKFFVCLQYQFKTKEMALKDVRM